MTSKKDLSGCCLTEEAKSDIAEAAIDIAEKAKQILEMLGYRVNLVIDPMEAK